MARCANPDCRAPLGASNRSGDTPDCCRECGELRWAFRPDRHRPLDWWPVGEPVDGARVLGDQCEACGLSEYTLENHGGRRWVARCAGQRWDGEDLGGCGAAHPVRQRPAWEVVDPEPGPPGWAPLGEGPAPEGRA